LMARRLRSCGLCGVKEQIRLGYSTFVRALGPYCLDCVAQGMRHAQRAAGPWEPSDAAVRFVDEITRRGRDAEVS
jgi:hypothetical protein